MSYIQILRDADQRFAEIDAMTLPRPDPAYAVAQALLATRGANLPESSVLWDITVYESTTNTFGQDFWRGTKDRKDVAVWILDDGNRLMLHEFTYDEVQSAQGAQGAQGAQV